MVIVVDEKDLEYAMYNYGFLIKFSDKSSGKPSQRIVKDLTASGYMWLARKYGLEGVESELEHYSVIDSDIRAVAKCTVIFPNGRFSSIADVDDRSPSVRDPSAVARVADTLAFKRAVARALGINSDMLQRFDVNDVKMSERREEEPYTPPPKFADQIDSEVEEVEVQEDIGEEWDIEEW